MEITRDYLHDYGRIYARKADRRERARVGEDLVASAWFGREPASEADVAAAEARLGGVVSRRAC